jgi:oligosaccharide repeat unit polymerase
MKLNIEPNSSFLLRRILITFFSIYICSFLCYLILLNNDLETLIISFISILLVSICALSVFFILDLHIKKSRARSSLIDNDILSKLYLIWRLTLIFLLIAIIDLYYVVYLNAALRDEFTLATIRGDFFDLDNHRSIYGRIAGLSFIIFSIISSIIFRLNGKWFRFIVSFSLAALFSLLMGGRGQIIFFALIACPALFERLSLWRIILIFLFLFLVLGFVYSLRTIDNSETNFIVPFAQYISSPWFGMGLLFSNYPGGNNLELLSFGAPYVLEYVAYPIFGGYGNVYGGMGQLIHSFGLIGGVIYLLCNSLFFIIFSYFNKKKVIFNIYMQHLVFLYFIFFIFHDLTVFYPSYLAAILFLFYIKVAFRERN